MEPETPPVEVNASPLAMQVRSSVRTILLLLSGLGLVVPFSGFLTAAQLHYLISDDFLPVLSALLAFGTWLWAQLEAIWHKKLLVDAANAAPDTKFVVKEPTK